MASLETARALADSGCFAKALDDLNQATIHPDSRLAADVLRSDLLERVGRMGHSRVMLGTVLRSRQLTDSQRSACEYVLSRLEWEKGDIESSISHVQRSIHLAKSGGDLERLCLSQLRLVSLTCDRSGPEAAAPLLAELRSNSMKLGDPQVTAALHITVGNMDGRRGLVQSGQRHTRLGQQLLSKRPNAWLESSAENSHLAFCILLSDFDAAVEHGRRCLCLIEQSGAPAARRTCLINLGNVFYSLGQFDKAVDYFNDAFAVLPSASEFASASLESVARTRLSQGLIQECAELIGQIDESLLTPKDRLGYVYRNIQLTRAHLLAREGRPFDALTSCESVIELSNGAGDQRLGRIALLTKAELLQQAGNLAASMETLDLVVPALAQQPPDLHAHYERILACALASIGEREAATLHFERARRLYESIRSTPGLLELSRRWDETANLTTAGASAPDTNPPAPAANTASAVVAGRDVLQTTAFLLRHHSRPELLARELVHLLAGTDAVVEARALSIGSGEPQVLAAFRGSGDAASDAIDRRIPVGFARDRAVELHLTSRRQIDAQATVNAVTVLLSTIQDLERARAEREERISLWPANDDGEEPAHDVVAGSTRELMVNAKRIGRTTANVLITGESGTGKEVFARAIHRHSERATKPFIPVNCTAVPRDMLESHLFGHRRGSFTGADRDHPGMIGAARDGTLFLDEIGEMGLDLQPKLLRFLESGEICPIGESTPFTISVRIVAATNTDVEQQVKDGRFRADLFYRLNVIRLRIPPLRERRDEIPGLVRHFVAHATDEFRKVGVRVSEEAMEHLLLCRWPGNIRQLQNEIRRMVALAEPNAVLTPADLSEDVFNPRLATRPVANELEMVVSLKDKLQPALSKVEREIIRLALQDHPTDLDAAARALGISRKGLYLKRQRHGL
jgi:DNA-binding NtrC family response regulator/tetratricopeptide (TPR) repeat protein